MVAPTVVLDICVSNQTNDIIDNHPSRRRRPPIMVLGGLFEVAPTRAIASQQLKANLPMLVVVYIALHADLYRWLSRDVMALFVKTVAGVSRETTRDIIWWIGEGARAACGGRCFAARRLIERLGFPRIFGAPRPTERIPYAILLLNIAQAVYSMIKTQSGPLVAAAPPVLVDQSRFQALRTSSPAVRPSLCFESKCCSPEPRS
jgi:hypothetical protein